MSTTWVVAESVTFLADIDLRKPQTFGEEIWGSVITMFASIVMILAAMSLPLIGLALGEDRKNAKLAVGWAVSAVLFYWCSGRVFSPEASGKALGGVIAAVVVLMIVVGVAAMNKTKPTKSVHYGKASFVGVLVSLGLILVVLIYRAIGIGAASLSSVL